MNNSKNFNIHQYTSEIDSTDLYSDVFDELESLQQSNLARRFSFSIPEEKETNLTSESQLQIPPVPPSSPQLTSIPRLSVLVPDDNDDFYLDSTNIDYSSDDDDNNNIHDIQLFINYSKEDLMISPNNDNTLYKCPPRNSHDARKIWKNAKIPRISYIRDIESLLLDWAFTNASLEINNKSIKSITWKSKSNCVCRATWSAFINWMICASTST